MTEFPEELIERYAKCIAVNHQLKRPDESDIEDTKSVLRESRHGELVEALKLARPYIHDNESVGCTRALDVREKNDAALKKAGAL